MTREKAAKILRQEIECLSHTKCEDCILEATCDPIKTTPYDSEYIEVYEMAIKALEQDKILDKIRAEIDEQYDRVHPYDISCAEGLEMALGIIDKYKPESEDKDDYD